MYFYLRTIYLINTQSCFSMFFGEVFPFKVEGGGLGGWGRGTPPMDQIHEVVFTCFFDISFFYGLLLWLSSAKYVFRPLPDDKIRKPIWVSSARHQHLQEAKRKTGPFSTVGNRYQRLFSCSRHYVPFTTSQTILLLTKYRAFQENVILRFSANPGKYCFFAEDSNNTQCKV